MDNDATVAGGGARLPPNRPLSAFLGKMK